MRYLYLPFQDYGADPAWAGTVERYKRAGHTVIEHSYFFRPLNVVKPDDVLIIMGHGGKGENSRGLLTVKQVSLFGRESTAQITVNDLAAQIEGDGLSKNHKLVKSLTCYGAGELVINARTDVFSLKNENVEYFAKLLAKALGLRGYNNIVVGGFAGPVCSMLDQKTVKFQVVDDELKKYETDPQGNFRAKTRKMIRWHNSSGSCVRI